MRATCKESKLYSQSVDGVVWACERRAPSTDRGRRQHYQPLSRGPVCQEQSVRLCTQGDKEMNKGSRRMNLAARGGVGAPRLRRGPNGGIGDGGGERGVCTDT